LPAADAILRHTGERSEPDQFKDSRRRIELLDKIVVIDKLSSRECRNPAKLDQCSTAGVWR
jgi:hypothetical protein